MGRPPIGNAERTRRWREKIPGPAKKTPPPQNVTRAHVDSTPAALQARVLELEQELASAHEMLADGHVVIAEAKAILAAKGIMPPKIYKTVLHSVLLVGDAMRVASRAGADRAPARLR